MRTTVRLPDDLIARAKKRAADDGTTLTELIEEGLRLALERRAAPGSPGKSPADRLPASPCSGGLMPGVDPRRLLTDDLELEDGALLVRNGPVP